MAMTDEKFIALIKRLEKEATAGTTSYNLRTLLLALAGCFYIGSFLLIAPKNIGDKCTLKCLQGNRNCHLSGEVEFEVKDRSFPTIRNRQSKIYFQGFSATAFSAAMRPKAIISDRLPPPVGYRNPYTDPSSPAAYK